MPQDEGASTTGGSVKTSDIARLMEMFQVYPLVPCLVLHIKPLVPRVPFSSIGTLSLLMTRMHILTRPMLKITSPSPTGVTLRRDHSGGESDPRNEPRPPIRAKRRRTRHRGTQARAPILKSVNPATGRRGSVLRRRFLSSSLMRLTSCESTSCSRSAMGFIFPFWFALALL